MKKLTYVLVGLLIVGMCSIPLIAYWYYMGSYSVSSQGEWSEFAAVWSAAFGAVGSIATAATLGFLIWQYFFKQKELLDRNIEVINFQKYQIHKQLFNELLDSLESSFNDEVRFIDRGRVYKDIFPSNSFDATSYQINLDNECKAYDLADLSFKYNQFLEKLKNQDKTENHGSCQVQYLIRDVADLLYRLGIFIRRSPQVGDFLYNDKIVFNSKNQDFFLRIIERTINAFREFSGNADLPALSTYSNTSYLNNNLLGFAAEFDRQHHKIDQKYKYIKE